MAEETKSTTFYKHGTKDPVVVELIVKVEHLENTYVTKHEFQPVKIIAYGLAGIGLAGLITAIIQQVLISGGT